MKRPYAYVRKSTQGGADSRSDQTAQLIALAKRHGDADDLVILDGDWGVSASREKTEAKRLDFMRLMRAVEDGEVSAIYATNGDRLARSQRWAAQLADACADNGVLIHTPQQTFDLTTMADKMVWGMFAVMNENTLEVMRLKAKARVRAMRERGSRFGPKPTPTADGDIAPILQAYREAKSFEGAARLLTARKVMPLRADRWHGNTVKRVVTREAPSLVRKRAKRQRRSEWVA